MKNLNESRITGYGIAAVACFIELLKFSNIESEKINIKIPLMNYRKNVRIRGVFSLYHMAELLL